MLVEFTVGNFRSFREPVTLSMVAARLTSKERALDENNVFQIPGNPPLLTSTAIFGPNASGKSNLFSAIAFMRMFVLSSAEGTERVGGIAVEPFRLNHTSEQQASHFEIVFILDGARYRYGFEATGDRVVSEWLYMASKRVEAMLFERDSNDIKIGPRFKEGRNLAERTRPNALFLSVAAQWDGPMAQKVVQWFRRISVNDGGATNFGMRFFTENALLDGNNAKDIIELVRQLDVGIAGIKVEKADEKSEPTFPPRMPDDLKQALRTLASHADVRKIAVRTLHKVYDDEGNEAGEVEFDLDDAESGGTIRLFALAGPLIDTLKSGRLLVIDELDARLHPQLTREIVKLFNSRETNPAHAQLVFTAHNASLLDNSLFRRDQLWFAEKNSKGESQLYSMAEFRGVRNDLSLERNYIQGRFGAVPYVDGLTTFIKESQAAYGAQTE